MNELALARMNELPLPPRSRAAIRCACDAIRRLASLTEPHGRANAEAMLMEASLAFEDREFAAARSALLPLLESPVLCQLTEEDAFRALGLAARCAVVLDGEAAAKSFLERIPESRRAQI